MPRTRTAPQTEIPAAEQVPATEPWCPPHDFEAGWATPQDGIGDNIPALWCHYCGTVMAFRIPSDEA